MRLSPSEVEKIARLVKLDLSQDEKLKLSEMFSDTLEKINVLSELDTESITPTNSVINTQNVFSDPVENKATLDKDKALSQAKNSVKGLFATQAVLER